MKRFIHIVLALSIGLFLATILGCGSYGAPSYGVSVHYGASWGSYHHHHHYRPPPPPKPPTKPPRPPQRPVKPRPLPSKRR